MKNFIAVLYITITTFLFGYVSAENKTNDLRFEEFYINMSEHGATLCWNSDTDVYTNHFEIQRSVDNTPFKTVGLIFTIENNEEFKAYEFTDPLKRISAKNIRYRIKKVGINNTESFSQVLLCSL